MLTRKFRQSAIEVVASLVIVASVAAIGHVNSVVAMDGYSVKVCESAGVGREDVLVTYAARKLETKTGEELVEKLNAAANSGKFLLDIEQTDPEYKGKQLDVTGEDRELLERLVHGESGNQGFTGAALVAQAIRDAMVYDGYDSVYEVRSALGYAGRVDLEPNQDVKDAVAYVFDEGNSAVQHRILYFYSSNGGWHETQNFIVEYKAHRFFDRWVA